MAEFTAVAVQTVPAGQAVVLTDAPVCAGSCIRHRDGSGQVTLMGHTGQCRARYRVTFGANLAVPTGGTAGAISVGIAIDGDVLGSSIATVTPAAAGEFFNVFSSAFIDVPRGCCARISVRNVSAGAIDVANANLVIDRVA